MEGHQEWKHCSLWLIRCGVLPPDHKTTHPEATVFDLAQNLRDGVLLCHLLNLLSPGAVDAKDISQRPQMSQFLCLKNLRTFLQTCANRFGLQRDSLFDPYNLFDLTDFGRVVSTLAKLSKSPTALKTVSPGFPPDSFLPGSRYEEEEIYMHLEHFANENCIEDSQLDDVYDVVNKDDPEEIYEEMCKTSRPKKAASESTSLSFPSTKRDFCAQELLETEKNYVEALNMVHKNFFLPLRGFITKEDREKIFVNIDELRCLHTEFLDDLQRATPDRISACFEKHKDGFLVYGHYCSLLTKARDHIQSITAKSDQIRAKISECEKEAKNGKFRLRDILSVPMQRILKYPLLLRDLAKYTPETHPDRDRLGVALETMQDVARYINEVKRDNETINTILDIQRSITDINMPLNTYLTDYGKLQRDGVLRVKAHEDQNSRQRTRHVFLFDKVMLMCKPHGEEFRYKRALDLAKYKVEDRQTSDAGNWCHQFVLSDISNNHAYTCYAKTKEMKKKWVEAIRLSLENTIPPHSRTATHEFTLQTFPEPTYCGVCGKLLYGIFFQGYRCNRTDTNAHKDCIARCTLSAEAASSAASCRGRRRSSVEAAPLFRARAVTAYSGDPTPGSEFEVLVFGVDELIDVFAKCDHFWWQGRLARPPALPRPLVALQDRHSSPLPPPARLALFPAHFVKELPAPDQRSVLDAVAAISAASTTPTDSARPVLSARSSLSPTGAANGFPGPARFSGHALAPSQRLNILGGDAGLCGVNGAGLYGVDGARKVESDLAPFPWFVQQMERQQAEDALRSAEEGTFMIRESPRTGGFALSLVFEGDVKHIKIQTSSSCSSSSASSIFFLADIKFFSSIPSLVDFYSQTSLVGCFPGLDTVLKHPFHQRPSSTSPKASLPILSYAIAIFDFIPTDSNQVALRRGDRLAIVSKAGGDRGWWKGQVQAVSKKIGYFPKNYVKEEVSSLAAAAAAASASSSVIQSAAKLTA